MLHSMTGLQPLYERVLVLLGSTCAHLCKLRRARCVLWVDVVACLIGWPPTLSQLWLAATAITDLAAEQH
jgi:hypothetical protein